MGAPKRIHFNEQTDNLIKRAYLQGNRKSGNIKAASQKLGISTTSIHRRAIELGVLRAGNKQMRRWEEKEVELLEKNIHKGLSYISELLVKNGYPRRTEYSIKQKLKMIGIGLRESRTDAGIYSLCELSRLSGIQKRTLGLYIQKGWLKAAQRQGINQIEYDLKAKDIRQFYQDYTCNVDIIKADKYWLVDLLSGKIN